MTVVAIRTTVTAIVAGIRINKTSLRKPKPVISLTMLKPKVAMKIGHSVDRQIASLAALNVVATEDHVMKTLKRQMQAMKP